MIEGIVYPLIVAIVTAVAVAGGRWHKDRKSRRNPLVVSARTYISKGWQVSFTETQLLSEPHPGEPGRYAELYNWIKEKGAYDYKVSRLTVTLSNISASIALIDKIQIHKICLGDAENAAKVSFPTAGANELLVIHFDLEERDPEPVVAEIEGSAEPRIGKPFCESQYVTIAPGEVVQLMILGSAKRKKYEWTVELTVSVDGTSYTHILAPEGRPIRTSGEPATGFNSEWYWDWMAPERGLEPAFRPTDQIQPS